MTHFEDQIHYFDSLYLGVGIPQQDAEIRAKGAALGQMIGYAASETGNHYSMAANAFLKDVA